MIWCIIAALLFPSVAWAEAAQPAVEAAAAELRLKHLATELRCLVCQNQTLADSTAPLAEDLRREVREMIAKNMSDDDIVAFLVDRYGDFIRYRPAIRPATWLLWVGPFLLLAIGSALLFMSLRSRAQDPEDEGLSDDEQRRVQQLIGSTPP